MKTRILLLALVLIAAAATAAGALPQRVSDLAINEGDVPRRLVGYGLVVGLDGTGDRSFGGIAAHNATVHSVVNLLRRVGIEVPPEYLRLRNVAAVLVTAEVSPYLRAGGRFDVHVSALADAISLAGGVLWITPLVVDPNSPAVATAQGPLVLAPATGNGRYLPPGGNSARIPGGGILEVNGPPAIPATPRLWLREPNLQTARKMVAAINAAVGDSTAVLEDPGAVLLNPGETPVSEFLAQVDTISVDIDIPARVIIHGREGTVVAGGDVRVGPAVIHHQGITLEIGGAPVVTDVPGLLQVPAEASVQDVAAGLHAAGARPDEIAAIFEALHKSGALQAKVIVQ